MEPDHLPELPQRLLDALERRHDGLHCLDHPEGGLVRVQQTLLRATALRSGRMLKHCEHEIEDAVHEAFSSS